MQLRTERLVLRELEETDAAAANAYERDPTVVRYTSHDVRTFEESLEYIRRSRKTLLESPRRVYDLAMTLADTGRYIGRTGLHVTQPGQREATLWYIVEPGSWGRGYTTEAVRALLGLGFDTLGLHRVYLECDARNAGSARVAHKLGMRREAHLRENLFLKGEWTDSLIFAILEHEWRRERSNGV